MDIANFCNLKLGNQSCQAVDTAAQCITATHCTNPCFLYASQASVRIARHDHSPLYSALNSTALLSKSWAGDLDQKMYMHAHVERRSTPLKFVVIPWVNGTCMLM